MKRRKLQDLFVVGKPVAVGDGEGDPVAVWLQKLNPIQHEQAVRYAKAARSRILSLRNYPESPEYQALWLQVEEVKDPEHLVDLLATTERANRQGPREAELAADEEWTKDDYLQGLRDAWEGGIEDRFKENPEDPEASRVFHELDRFTKELDKILDAEVDAYKEQMAARSIEDLRQQVFDQILDLEGDIEWVREYHTNELFFAVRDPDDHKVQYFESRAEVEALSVEVFAQLIGEYRALTVDPQEGKVSAAIPSSSDSSEPPNPVEMVPSSGPEVASQ